MASPYRLIGGATRPDAMSGLTPQFNEAMTALYNAAPPEVQAELALTSAYRSPEVQKKLFEASDRSGKMVAPPGKSKHNFGTAADLAGFGLKGGGKGVSEATKAWVKQNAGKFGLTFPMDYEPWHIQLASAGGAQGTGQAPPTQKEAQAQQMKAAGYSPDEIQKAFLNTIASSESPGYDVMYGGGKFADYSRHPNQPVKIQTGPNANRTSTAAGRYQFLAPTWEEMARKYGYKDFSPQNQDAAAWQLAQDTYSKNTGGDLTAALKSGDPGRINAAADVLKSQWTSLPGGIEQSKGYGGKTFYDVYSGQLGPDATGGPGLGGPSGTPGAAAGSSAPAPTTEEELAGIGKRATAAVSNALGYKKRPFTPNVQQPVAVTSASTPIVDPQQRELQRQRLAEILQRLNSGSLV